MQGGRQPKLHELQVLRAIAATLVIIDHAIYYRNSFAPTGLSKYIGDLGVAIFFVISGLIMMISAGDKAGAREALIFAVRRIIRIVPIYWIATFLQIILHFKRHSMLPDGAHFLASLFFYPLPEGVGREIRPVLGQGWTLDLEMMFYAIFACVIWMGVRRKALTLGLALVALVVLSSFSKPLTDTREATTTAAFIGSPIIILFGLGALLGETWKKTDWRMTSNIVVPGSLALVGGALLVQHLFDAGAGKSSLGLEAVTWGVALATTALCAFSASVRLGWFTKIYEKLGDSSYSAYLFHGFVLERVLLVYHGHVLGEGMGPYLVVSLVLSFLAALLINAAVEKPLTSALRQLLDGPRLLVPRSASPAGAAAD